MPDLIFRIKASVVMKRDPDPEVSQILSLVRLCQGTRSLPRSGGLLEQDAYFVYLFEQVLIADQERAKRDEPRKPPGVR